MKHWPEKMGAADGPQRGIIPALVIAVWYFELSLF